MTKTKRIAARIAIAVVVIGIAALAAWHFAAQWRPDRAVYPTQGVALGAANGAAPIGRLHAAGADFAYFDASTGANRHDPRFADNRDDARVAGMRYGAIHHYDLCATASEQAANFARFVPRDAGMLPPILQLDFSGCDRRPTRALVLSELTTFLAQAERHAGLPMVLMPDAAFDRDYRVTQAFARSVGVVGDFREPAYAARRWALWRANDWARIAGVDGAARWIVVYPPSPTTKVP